MFKMKRFTYLFLSSLFLFSSCTFQKKQHHKNLKIDFFSSQNYKYSKVDTDLQMAYLDLGDINDPIVLLIHGEPNNSFIYRNIAPNLIKEHFRVIIPDLIGFGYSDKPKNSEIITYSNETKWLTNFIHNLNLKNIHLFAHDWGGMLALRIIAKEPNTFTKVAVSYCFLFEGNEVIPKSFIGFKNYAKNDSTFQAGNIMNWGSNVTLPDSIIAKYNSPFQKKSDFNAIRKFPSLIPISNNDPEAILNIKLNQNLRNFKKPFITIWGNNNDLMWKGKDSILQHMIPGSKSETHYSLNANHFIQEDKPEELSKILIDFFKKKN